MKTGYLLFFVIFVLACGKVQEDPDDQSSKLLAYSYAKDFVSEKLKNPSSAEFPGIFDQPQHVTHLGNWEYKIDSWVESTNSFNAVIKTKFTCIIKIDNEEGTVSMRDLQFK